MSANHPIAGGIETIAGPHGNDEYQCARCGGDAQWVRCANCGGEKYTHHDCGEDSCCCRYPEDNVLCDWCRGTGGSFHCVNTPEWCNAHPLAGRESVESTAMRAEAWDD